MIASATRKALTGSLLVTASAIALASPAHAAHEKLFASNAEVGDAALSGRRVTQTDGVTQVRLEGGGIASFVDSASYTINEDGTVDLYSGSVTVTGSATGAVVVRLADKGQASVIGADSAASFSVDEEGASGHVLTGSAQVAVAGGTPRDFTGGQMWRSNDGDTPRLVVANNEASVPNVNDGSGAGADEPPVLAVREGGPVAAAINGLPVVLGDGLAAAGATGDILTAAQRIDSALANPSIETFPAGDFALLVAYAAQLEGAYGGQPFDGAQADVIRAYIQFLAGGGSGAGFLTAYAGLTTQYLDLIRAGAVPSSFSGASLDQINAYLGYIDRTSGFGGLSAQNAELVDAYLAFLGGGGSPNGFTGNYVNLTESYFTFLRGGGAPADFQQASLGLVEQYLAFLSDSGLADLLSSTDQALLAAYLGGNGLAFAGQYETALSAYFSHLAGGQLPSAYTVDPATLQAYLETLQATGLFDQILDKNAGFYAAYLAFVQGGGAPDAYADLPANVFAGYGTQLQAYYAYLLQGGIPTSYSDLTQAQIAAYLAALDDAGASTAFLDNLGTFYSGYLAYVSGGGNPDVYTGLPVLALPTFADALNTYSTFLAGGGLPSGYSAEDLDVLSRYLQALVDSGQADSLLGNNINLLTAYFAFLGTGSGADQFSGLPIYGDYSDALQAYFSFLDGGGLPANYTALTPAQINAYLTALGAAGGLSEYFGGELTSFYTSYFAFIQSGGSPANFADLPAYDTYASALTAYFSFLDNGGLPDDYTALTPTQISAYLAALQNAGGFTLQLGSLANFYSAYFSHLGAGGAPTTFSGLPIYGDYASALSAYFSFLDNGGLPADYTALTPAQISAYLTALQNAGGFAAQLGNLSTFYSAYFAHLGGGGTAATFSGLPVYSSYVSALGAYFSFLDNGGLPADYTALTPAQISAYLTALQNAGGFSTQLGNLSTFYSAYFAHLGGGGTAATFSGLPVYSSYVSALGAYFSFLDNGGLPADYTALTPAQISAYLTALQNAGGFSTQLGNLSSFYSAYFAHLGTGGSPATFSGLPAYAGYLSAIQAFYAFIANGGLPSDYTSLSAAQVQAYLAALSGSGLLVGNFDGADLSLLQTYLAFLGNGGNYDQFDGLPVNVITGPLLQFAGARVYRNSAYGNLVFEPDSVDVAENGTITKAEGTGGLVGREFDYSANSSAVAENGRFGDELAFTRYAFGAVDNLTNHQEHILAGTPATNIPTSGQVIYALVGGTAPTDAFGELDSIGIFTGELAVAFNAVPEIGLEFDVFTGTRGWHVATQRGAADPQFAGLHVNPDMSFTDTGTRLATTNLAGDACDTNCTINLAGSLFGDGGGLVGFTYSIYDASSSTTSYTSGSAVFGTSGTQLAQLGTQPVITPPVVEADPNVWILSGNGGLVGTAPTFTVETSGQITQTGYQAGPVSGVQNYDYSAATNVLGDHGWVEDVVAWTSYEQPAQGILTNFQSHIMLGAPAINLPTSGKVDYALIGGTAPTDIFAPAGEAGTLTGNLSVQFGTTPLVGFDLDILVGDRGWHVQTTSGAEFPGAGGLPVGENMRFESSSLSINGTVGDACNGFCNFSGFGGLFGDGASHAGLTYLLQDESNNDRSYINGNAIFGAGATGIDRLGTLPSTGGNTGGNGPALTTYAGGFISGAGSAYATNGGNSQPANDVPTVSSTGALIDAGNLANSTATAVDIAGDSLAIVGRFADGGATFLNNLSNYQADGGLPYVILAPVTGDLPTSGTIDYEVFAATNPVFTDAGTAPGTFDASVTIGFGTQLTYKHSGSIIMPEAGGDVTYNFASAGFDNGDMVNLLSGGGDSRIMFGDVTGTGRGCTGSGCRITFFGGFAGASPEERLGMTYSIYGGSGSTPRIQGAVVFAPVGTPAPTLAYNPYFKDALPVSVAPVPVAPVSVAPVPVAPVELGSATSIVAADAADWDRFEITVPAGDLTVNANGFAQAGMTTITRKDAEKLLGSMISFEGGN